MGKTVMDRRAARVIASDEWFAFGWNRQGYREGEYGVVKGMRRFVLACLAWLGLHWLALRGRGGR